jgi:hypothetical protein
LDAKGAKSEGSDALLGALGKGVETSDGLSSIGAGTSAAGGPGSAIKLDSFPAADSGWSGEADGLEMTVDIGTGAGAEPSSRDVEFRSLVLTRTISAGRVGMATGLLFWTAAGPGWVAAREGTGRRGTLGHAASANGRSRLRKDSPLADDSNGFSGGLEAVIGDGVFSIGSRFACPTASVDAVGGSVEDKRGEATSSTPIGFPEARRLEDLGDSEVTGRDSMRGSRSRRPEVLERWDRFSSLLEEFNAASRGGAGAVVASTST